MPGCDLPRVWSAWALVGKVGMVPDAAVKIDAHAGGQPRPRELRCDGETILTARIDAFTRSGVRLLNAKMWSSAPDTVVDHDRPVADPLATEEARRWPRG
jgi:hypothetical protein